jgi:hypothetical protein
MTAMRAPLAAMLIALSATLAQCATAMLDAAADASIFQNNPNNASGGGNGLFTGANTSGFPRRALIAFDISGSLPAGATVQSAELTLVLGDVSGAGARPEVDIALHRVLASWGEGTTQQRMPPDDVFSGIGQGAPAATGDVTWNARFFSPTEPAVWNTPGGDFQATPSTMATIPAALGASYTFPSSAAIVSDVQGWLDNPASNFGWLLKGVDESLPSSLRGFYSSEVATAMLHPKLSVTFTAPSAAADFNDDGKVDGADLIAWQGSFGQSSGADGDGDDDSDGADFLLWQRELGTASAAAASSAVPEPLAWTGLAAAALAGWAQLRRKTV